MPIWVPIVAAAIGGMVAIIIFILSGQRERAKSKREAVSKFRAAFAEELVQIGKVDSFSLLKRKDVQVKHDIAIHEFRRIISPKFHTEFDATVERFNQCRENLVPAAISFFAAGEPVDELGAENMKVALNDLLAFADKP